MSNLGVEGHLCWRYLGDRQGGGGGGGEGAARPREGVKGGRDAWHGIIYVHVVFYLIYAPGIQIPSRKTDG